MSTDSPAAVCGENLTVRYRPEAPAVLTGQNVTIPRGKITVLIGPNGCGKSTLLKTLARQLAPVGGKVVLNGREIATLGGREIARELGILFQENLAPHDLTVEELAMFGRYPHLRFLESPRPADYAAVEKALELSGATPLRCRSISELSSGQRQLAWIAMLLAQETPCMFLDEPTTFLDPAHQFTVMDRIRALNRELGITMALSIHDLNLAARYADHMVAMRAGTVISAGRPEEVLTPDNLRQIFGITARIIRDENSGTLFCLPTGKTPEE